MGASKHGLNSDNNVVARANEQDPKLSLFQLCRWVRYDRLMASYLRGLVAAVLMLSATACAHFNPALFTPLDRAGREIAGVMKDRPSLPKFKPLRQSFSTALNDVRPRVESARERTLFGDYEVIDQRLGEMLAVWEGLEEREESMIPVTGALGTQLKTRYELPVNTNQPPSIYANEALYALRDDIVKRVDEAHTAIATR